MSQHSSRTESWENSECLWERAKKTRQESCDLDFFKNTELSLECVFMLLPGVADRGAVVHMPPWKSVFLPHGTGLSLWLHTLSRCLFFISKSIHGLAFWIVLMSDAGYCMRLWSTSCQAVLSKVRVAVRAVDKWYHKSGTWGRLWKSGIPHRRWEEWQKPEKPFHYVELVRHVSKRGGAQLSDCLWVV